MSEINLKGKVFYDPKTDEWYFDTTNEQYSSDFLTNLDGILEEIGHEITEQNDLIEITTKINSK